MGLIDSFGNNSFKFYQKIITMKNKMAIAVGTMILTAGMAAFIFASSERNVMENLFDANVEALARSESGSKAMCYSQYSVNETMRCLECGTCKYVDGAGVDKGGYCKF